MKATPEQLQLAQENVDFWEQQSMHDFEETICAQSQGAAVEYMFSAEAYRLSSRRYRIARDELRFLGSPILAAYQTKWSNEDLMDVLTKDQASAQDQSIRDAVDKMMRRMETDEPVELETYFDDDEPEDI